VPLWHPAAILATWFGAGLLPLMPGTWGSLAALAFGWVIQSLWGWPGLAIAAAVVFLLGCWASGVVARASGVNDAGAIVIDEVAAQWLVLAVGSNDAATYVLGFLLFRLADILKPWPARWADRRLDGGFGVMLDDIFAAVYAAALLALLLNMGNRIVGG
jgi:phosphatidylglycerophosphatase A